MNDINRILNLQSYIHQHFPDVRSAESITIAQHAELSLMVAATDPELDPFDPIRECIDELLPDRIAVENALMAIGLIETDRRWNEARA